MGPSLRCTGVALAGAMFCGCYQYTGIAPAAVETTSEVRLTLTAQGAGTLTPVLGRSAAAVEGRVVRLSDTAYVLAVASTLKRTEEDTTSLTRTTWSGESVTIPRSAVAAVELRSLDRRRTTIVAGLTTALGILAAKLIVHGVGSSGTEPDAGMPVVTP